jgi:hypothetical protein
MPERQGSGVTAAHDQPMDGWPRVKGEPEQGQTPPDSSTYALDHAVLPAFALTRQGFTNVMWDVAL